mgnify:CR=1 FL=1
MTASYTYAHTSGASHDLGFLKSRGVADFVHFTAADNLDAILRRGLLPRAALDVEGVDYVSTDTLRLEGRDVVNLSITNPNIRMFYGKRKDLGGRLFSVLTLDPSLLADAEGAYEFRATNAASRFSQPCRVEELFAGDRPSFFERNWPTDNQAELLVRGAVSPSSIKTIQFPYSSSSDQQAVDTANRVVELSASLGLHCRILFCDQHFDYNKSYIGKLEPRERYQRYFVSWASDEQAAAITEEAIRLVEREKAFDSIALLSTSIAGGEIHPDREVNPLVTWSLRYRAPEDPSIRDNAQLSAFAVIEKIINRGRRTRLSPDLESQLRSDDEAAWAHQTQCAIVELLKHQALLPGNRVYCGNWGRPTEVFAAALDDLKGLSKNVCRLYGCDDLLSGVESATSASACDVIVSWSDDPSGIRPNEARISGFKEAPKALPFDFTRVVEPSPIEPDRGALLFLLRYVFGLDGFREGQLEAIRRGLRRQDTVVLLPTGSGKSIVFQLLSLITPGIAFVVCPIISLIEDQISNLRQRGFDRVTGLSSAMDSGSRNTVLEGITSGQYLICYVAPERFQDRSFNASVRRYASTNLISIVAIDEAHCVSEWGHEFRTAYLGLSRTCREVCGTGDAIPPLLALTGTASTSVLTDMMNDLEIDDEFAIIQPSTFDRPEIHYRVIRVPSSQKLDALGHVVSEIVPADFHSSFEAFYNPNGDNSNCGIVFCQNANGSYGLMASEKALSYGHPGVWDYLQSRLPGLCSFYSGKAPHRLSMSGGRWNAEKRAQAARFKDNETTVMVATKAFGMGIDKPNVRWVAHFGMPGSLESYYQEVGRAARDRKVAYAYLLLSDDFHDLNEELLDPSRTPITEMGRKDASKGKWRGDDVSRVAHFHSSTFEGVESELRAALGVLNACGRNNWSEGQWHVQFLSDDKEPMERAIYRFRILGVFDGYAIDYNRSGGTFVIKPSGLKGSELRSHVVESYLDYIRAYQPDEAYLYAAERNLLDEVGGAVNDRDYIMRAMRHLLSSFVYKVLEEGRRRATKTMLDAANSAADAGGGGATDSELRKQMLAYLSTGGQLGEAQGIRALLHDATNLRLIMDTIHQGEKSKLMGQASRLLEDYPEHYGLHFIQAAFHALAGDAIRFGPALRAMTGFGTRNYGLSRDECATRFTVFMSGEAARDIDAETIEALLPVMSDCFGRSEDELLALITSPQADILRSTNAIYDIARIAREGLRWTRAR